MRQTVQPIVQTQAEYSAGSIDESMLSNDEKEMIAQFANEIDISNAKQVIQYGSSAQKSISDFSVNILGKVKTSELGTGRCRRCVKRTYCCFGCNHRT